MCVIDFIVVVENRFYYDVVVSQKSHEALHLDADFRIVSQDDLQNKRLMPSAPSPAERG